MRSLSALLCAALVLAPVAARADDEPPPHTPLLKGEVAPHSGVLVTESQMRVYLLQRADLGRAKAQLEVRDAAIKKAAERSWVETNGVWVGLAVGAVLGAGSAVAVIYAVKR